MRGQQAGADDLKIWGRVNSVNVRKVVWAAEELGLAYAHENAGGSFGVVDGAQYRALNPNGRIPVLEDGEVVLWESNAIVRYLARRYGQAGFAAAGEARWAAADKWMDWASISFGTPYRNLFWNMVRTAPEDRKESEIREGIDHCTGLMGVADAALAKAPYLSGDALGIGDIPLGCIAYGWFEMPIKRPSLPHLEDWYRRLQARPAFRKGVMTGLT